MPRHDGSTYRRTRKHRKRRARNRTSYFAHQDSDPWDDLDAAFKAWARWRGWFLKSPSLREED